MGDEAAGCYFNDVRLNDVRRAEGAHLLSGNTRPCCERGIRAEVGKGREQARPA